LINENVAFESVLFEVQKPSVSLLNVRWTVWRSVSTETVINIYIELEHTRNFQLRQLKLSKNS
jgi:hypothetical protein